MKKIVAFLALAAVVSFGADKAVSEFKPDCNTKFNELETRCLFGTIRINGVDTNKLCDCLKDGNIGVNPIWQDDGTSKYEWVIKK